MALIVLGGGAFSVAIALAVLAASILLGKAYATWYLSKPTVNKSWLKILFYSNWVAWILPLLGFFVASATYTMNRNNTGDDKSLYMTYAATCLSASVLNSVVTLVLVLSNS